MLGLVTRFVIPSLSGPGVLRHGGEEDERGLVVHAPGREALAVERPLELGVEALGVLPHSVDPSVIEASGRSDAQVLGPVELRLGVLGGVEQRFPPLVLQVAGAGQGVAGVELVPDGAVFVAGAVALGLVTRELSVLGLADGDDDLLEQRAGGGPEPVTAAVGFSGDTPTAPRQRLSGVAHAVDDDSAALTSAPAWRRDDTAASRGLNLVEVRATPRSVSGVGMDTGGPPREVEREVGEYAALAASSGGVEMGQSFAQPMS